MRVFTAARLLACLALVGAVAACGGGTPSPPRLAWQERTLPTPAGERAVLQSATWCGDRWYVVGATADSRGATVPAIWTSTDTREWSRVPVHPGHDLYARQAVLAAVACSRGRVAALGEKPGGAHGNPRVQTWQQLPDGSLAAVTAPFEQYAGQDGISVNGLAGSATGFLLSGTRVSGAAVWSSRTGARFTLHDQAPGLATTPAASTQANDAVPWAGSWTVVGDSVTSRLVGTAWTGSGQGPWTPTHLPGGTHVTTADKVTLADTGPVVAGLDDSAFGIWSLSEGHWALASTFGSVNQATTLPAFVSGLAWTGSRLVVTYADGADYRLAVGTTSSLTEQPLPAPVGDRGDHDVSVAAHGSDLLLLTDDGHRGRLWLARA
ncbi:MAG: hypothetical protein QM747_20800 [Nocardioides sp.]